MSKPRKIGKNLDMIRAYTRKRTDAYYAVISGEAALKKTGGEWPTTAAELARRATKAGRLDRIRGIAEAQKRRKAMGW